MSNLNSDFWNIVGDRAVSWRDLEIGELFLLERGPARMIMKVVKMDADSFDCQLTYDPLPERHKVIVIGGNDD